MHFHSRRDWKHNYEMFSFVRSIFRFCQRVRAAGRVISAPQHIVVDSKDNVFVTLKYGLLKIAPDGTVTDLSKQGPVIGGMDRTWPDLIIDSKDNLYAHDGKVIYKIAVSKITKPR